jgi:hypothetical protein
MDKKIYEEIREALECLILLCEENSYDFYPLLTTAITSDFTLPTFQWKELLVESTHYESFIKKLIAYNVDLTTITAEQTQEFKRSAIRQIADLKEVMAERGH